MAADAVAITFDGERLEGLRMSIGDGERRRSTTVGEGQSHASFLEDEGTCRGDLAVRLPGEWTSKARFCVYWRATCILRVYRTADDALRGKTEATITVTIARIRGPNEIMVRTHEGETIACIASSPVEAVRWIEPLASSTTSTTIGYVYVDRKKGPWKRRWAVYCHASRVLCLYQAKGKGGEQDSLAFYAQAFEAKSRGHLTVEHAIKKSLPKLPFAFQCISTDGQAMRMSADGPAELDTWVDAMPLLKDTSRTWAGPVGAASDAAGAAAPPAAAPPPPFTLDVDSGHAPPPPPPQLSGMIALTLEPGAQLTRAASSRGVLLEAMRTELAQLRAKEVRGAAAPRLLCPLLCPPPVLAHNVC